jgi:toxin HigB-1
VIRGFACREAEQIFQGTVSLALPLDIQTTARRKLKYLDTADSLTDLHAPRGNRLEALKGKRKGQYSIRINAQWRICFEWKDGDATKVEIVDYH